MIEDDADEAHKALGNGGEDNILLQANQGKLNLKGKRHESKQLDAWTKYSEDKQHTTRLLARNVFRGEVHSLSVSEIGEFIAGGATVRSQKGASEVVILWSRYRTKLHSTVIGAHEKKILSVAAFPISTTLTMYEANILPRNLGLIASAGLDETFRIWKWSPVRYICPVQRTWNYLVICKQAPSLKKNANMLEKMENKTRDGLSSEAEESTLFDPITSAGETEGSLRDRAMQLLRAVRQEKKSTDGALFAEVGHKITKVQAKQILDAHAEDTQTQDPKCQQFAVGDFVKARWKQSSELYDCVVLGKKMKSYSLKYVELGEVDKHVPIEDVYSRL